MLVYAIGFTKCDGRPLRRKRTGGENGYILCSPCADWTYDWNKAQTAPNKEKDREKGTKGLYAY
jgi:hypothetical protein